MGIEDVTVDNTNPDSEILFSMNVDKQDINIVVDKETTEVKAVHGENNTETPTKDKGNNTKKQFEAEVHVETKKLAENVNKEESIVGNKEEIIKVIGEVSVERKAIAELSTSIESSSPTTVQASPTAATDKGVLKRKKPEIFIAPFASGSETEDEPSKIPQTCIRIQRKKHEEPKQKTKATPPTPKKQILKERKPTEKKRPVKDTLPPFRKEKKSELDKALESDARRLPAIEEDEHIKVQDLLTVCGAITEEEMQQCLDFANETIFQSRHKHVSLMVKQVTPEQIISDVEVIYFEAVNKQVEDIEPPTISVHMEEVKVEQVTAPSGKATGVSQQVQNNDKILDSHPLLALDTSSQVDFGRKSIDQLRNSERMMVATQRLLKEGSEEKQVIVQAIPVLQQLVPKYTSLVASPSGKLKGLTEHIAKEFQTLQQVSNR
ncbi:uncharacterized protein LOC131876511 [Cryptomeria japonica]|uniref:uncharacterized protein LOC131876511 n=1 Tax=Cryptomeria japonica TaxID=3369 RepID=UPI0027D9F93B|nr:uncharacterized protein LOC131876511 [Cryptomeria japonica]